MRKDPVRFDELWRVWPRACVAVWHCGLVWPRAVGFTVAGVAVRVRGGHYGVCVRVAGVRCGRVRVWPCVAVWPVRVAGAVCLCGVGAKRGGPVAGPPLCGVQAAVSYSPTPWRVQYHRRWQS